jgi:hypothetical protein
MSGTEEGEASTLRGVGGTGGDLGASCGGRDSGCGSTRKGFGKPIVTVRVWPKRSDDIIVGVGMIEESVVRRS